MAAAAGVDRDLTSQEEEETIVISIVKAEF